MIKGDIRKQQILDTAERLFTSRGFEATSVQDILDEMRLSKGSFYHHYATKEDLLRKICENRAERTAPKTDEQEASPQNGLQRMNGYLHEMIPFHGEGMVFLKMICPVFSNAVGKSVREGYADALKKAWAPYIEQALAEMIREGSGYTQYPEMTSSIAMDLVNDLWQQLGDEIIGSSHALDPQISASLLLEKIEPYRCALENLMCAPYGSLELLKLQDILNAIDTVHEWKS